MSGEVEWVQVQVPVYHRTKTSLAVTLLLYYGLMLSYVKFWQAKVLKPTGTLYEFITFPSLCPPTTGNDRCTAAAVGLGSQVSIIQWKSFDWIIAGHDLPIFRYLFGGSLPVYSSDFGSLWMWPHLPYLVVLPFCMVLVFFVLRYFMVFQKKQENVIDYDQPANY